MGDNAVRTGASMSGCLITLEGGEGAGKSTLLEGLRTHLAERGIEPVLTREPGGTPLGEKVRALVLDEGHGPVCAESELLLMFAARAQLVRETLRPALQDGRVVLCDRFTDASFAYQGGGRGQPAARIADLERWAVDGLAPDLTILLDVPVDTGRQRIAGRAKSDRIERENDGFFERVRAAYRQRASADPGRFCVIDADQSADRVLAQAVQALDHLLDGVAA